MALFIRDHEVEVLADELWKLTKVKTKTEAVRDALRQHLIRERQARPLRKRLARSKALADAMGHSDEAFDMKAFTDQMWSI